MSERPLIKICGLTTPDTLDAAVAAGAHFLGFVFFEKSKRHLPHERAAELINRTPSHVRRVGLFVDAADDEISAVLSRAPLDYIQLHGHETPERIAHIRARFSLPVMKAIKVAAPEDLMILGPSQAVADWILFDAKIDNDNGVPGGNGTAFDWRLLKNIKIAKPWMLSGGLNAGNIREALSVVSPDGVDVSSGVESAPGLKSPEKIREFIAAVQAAAV